VKILILGGTGLISTSITRQLVERGENVIHFNRGKTPQRFDGIVQTIQGDRNNFSQFENLVQEYGNYDCVIDMICFNREQAESSLRAFRGKLGHYIFCSTVNVYTKPAPSYPVREDFPRVPINDEYGTKKVECEDRFIKAYSEGDFPITILRPAQTYGEGGVIIHTFGWSTTYLDRIRKGKPIVVHGDGSSLWNPCHVDDVGRAFCNSVGNSKSFGRAYNITGEEIITWNQYHQRVAMAMGAPEPNIVHIPTDLLYRLSPGRCSVTYNNFQGNNVYDNSLAMNDLQFRYTISWVEGVRRTVKWLEDNNRIENSDLDPFDDKIITTWQNHCRMMEAEISKNILAGEI